MEYKIIPYVSVDGIRTFPDSYIKSLYSRMEDEGSTAIVFSDGEILSSDSFLSAMKYGQNYLFVIYVDDKEAAVLWLNRFKSKTCYAHFCGFKNSWGKGSVDIGKYAMKHVLNIKNSDDSKTFDTVLGLVSGANVVAIKWLKKVGLKEIGVVPNGLWNRYQNNSEDGMLLCITRESFGG